MIMHAVKPPSSDPGGDEIGPVGIDPYPYQGSERTFTSMKRDGGTKMAEAHAQHGVDPVDLIDIDSLLDDEERLIQSTVRAFVNDKILPEIDDWFERAVLPVEIARELGKLGLFGMTLNEHGAGASAVAYGLACLELEAGDSGFRSFMSVQSSLVMDPIAHYGSAEQQQCYLPGLASGDLIGCFGLTEPDSGSDPASMRTSARRDGGDWVLNGSKLWITNGSISDVALIWAQTDAGIRGFLVPTDTPGFEATTIHHKMSLRASVTSALSFIDCRIPADAVLEGVSGLKGPLTCLNEARFGIVFGAMGAARACFAAALDYSLSRLQFDRPVASFQLTQAKLADMSVELSKGMLLALHIGRLKDAGRVRPEQVSIGKLNNAREALTIARTSRTILAANGITLDYPVIRHAANLESVITYEGTAEIHQLSIGRALTGISAFS